MLSVPFKFGNALGEPGNPEYQHEVLEATFGLLRHDTGPVLKEFQSDIAQDPVPQASDFKSEFLHPKSTAREELRLLAEPHNLWKRSQGGRTSVGLSTIPPEHFDKMIDFLEGYCDGSMMDMDGRPSNISVPQFIRCCADDLKAFCYEARMAQNQNEPDTEVHNWFWTNTAIGSLIIKLSKRMREDDDKEVSAAAFGIAR